jgi:hypothetical protein
MSTREHSYEWKVLGYITNLETGSSAKIKTSAKKKKEQGSMKTRGRGV